MSEFDVRLADAERSRILSFAIIVGVAILILAGVILFMKDGPSSQANAETLTSKTALMVSEDEHSGRVSNLALSAEDFDQVENLPVIVETDPIPQLTEHDFFTQTVKPADVERIDLKVRRGQTFASVLDRAGASRIDAARAIAALEPLFSARNLRSGQTLSVFIETVQMAVTENESKQVSRLAGFSFRPDSERTLTVSRSADDFKAREAVQVLKRELVRAKGEVSSSLYISVIEAGATDRIVLELAKILGFAVDFRTIQPGDDFDIVFERFVNQRGETMRTGDILYLVFDGRRDPLEYFRFETPEGDIGYYTENGESAQRLLMKMPINGARISSSFGMRFHPVLARNKPHNGTDFAAPTGTPIMAAGNGIIERANRFSSFGNYIRIRHANGYKTIYAHLNGFARGIRKGVRVQQGQTIGYVGATGRVTGPHLHYEVHLNNGPTNPMALNLPTGKKLDKGELELFTEERERLVEVRDTAMPAKHIKTQLANLDPDAS